VPSESLVVVLACGIARFMSEGLVKNKTLNRVGGFKRSRLFIAIFGYLSTLLRRRV
jgi:hypothetical protein